MTSAAPVHALLARLWPWLPEGNLTLSPCSVAVALSMAARGARGETLAQLLDVLGVDDVSGLELPTLPSAVSSANALFGDRGMRWEPDFLDALAGEHDGELRAVDFAGATEAARDAVNTWTSQHTAGRIDEIVPDGALSELTRLVLVNALYLKANWADEFEPDATQDRPFRLTDGTRVDVPTMHSRKVADAHAAGDGWTAVRLSYDVEDLALTVVLPDEGRAPDDVVGALPEALASLAPAEVALSLPRWTNRSAFDLSAALEDAGLTAAFTADADFSAMTTTERIWIGAVLHQVFVAIDEAGTEAAAATAVLLRTTGLPVQRPEPIPFVVDRPFLFVIHDLTHGTPLFVGRVVDPRA